MPLIDHGYGRGINPDPRHVFSTCRARSPLCGARSHSPKLQTSRALRLDSCHYPVIIRVLIVPYRPDDAVLEPFDFLFQDDEH
jgi:hypothetical protein